MYIYMYIYACVGSLLWPLLTSFETSMSFDFVFARDTDSSSYDPMSNS